MTIQAIRHRTDLHQPGTKIHGTRPRYARTGWCRWYTSSCSARTPARAGLLQADAGRRGPALFLAGDWVPRDVVAMPWYAGQQFLSLQELHGLTAGLPRVSEFLAERGYRWHGTTRHRIPAHDLLADTRRQPDLRPRVRISQIDRPVHGHASTSEDYHSSAWSSSLVTYRQNGLTLPGDMPGARDDGHTRPRIPKSFLIAPWPP